MFQKMKSKFASLSALLTLALVSPLAMATGPTAPDMGEILALFPVYVAAVVGVIIGFAVARWTKRAANLANPG